ncbi:MAG: efflux RND transporter permease subunit [Devosiaceae bacterium]|nr:efflux RND transporter permease subunit [Devosiaceae bacterium MH13]
MQIARASIEKPLYTWLLILFCLFGGIAGYTGVGKLEDPTFTLKSALVITPYPGASASEVASEVSEVLEAEIQQMGEIDTILSRNVPGLSVIEVEMQDTFDGTELPQIWDDLRDRVDNARGSLPPGALPPTINDSFGDVFGVFYAVKAPGFSDAQVWEIATFLRREVLTVPGVANVEAAGLPEEAIYIEPSQASLANLGVDPGAIISAVQQANALNVTGEASSDGRQVEIDSPEPDDSVSAISRLTFGVQGEVLNLTDFSNVYRARVDQPSQIIRHNGEQGFTLAIAGLTSANIVTVGQAIEEKITALEGVLPLGVELSPIYEQHRVVDAANAESLQNVLISVGIVIGVLALFMGWRSAIVVGVSLLLTVSFTFFFMNLFDIKVERISLGALIIAMGMLVDNAIVVAEGMQVEMRKGRKAKDAAAEVARKTQFPLLGATVIGILAFAGIGLSPDSSGEFLFSLFAVIGISLMLSWLLAVTVTPLFASYMFKVGGLAEGKDPYDTLFFRMYGGLVRGALAVRWLVIPALIGITVTCMWAMSLVTQQFFPPANTPLFYLNYQAAQGTSIHETADDLAVVEDWLSDRPDVLAFTSSAGGPFSRYTLTYTPSDRDPAYGQIIIRAESFQAVEALRADLDAFALDALPWAEVRTQQIIYGPPVGADVEVRISGPDPNVLRELADEAQLVFETATDNLLTERIDWRERELTVQPIFAAERAQALGVTRADVSQSIAIATDGLRAGVFREQDRLIPILVRTPREEQTENGLVLDQKVFSRATQDYVPLEQVIDGFDVEVRDTLIERRNRVPTISVQSFTPPGVMPPTAFGEVREQIEAIAIPPGYTLEWGGEYESSTEAQISLASQMPLAFGAMLLLTILVFGKLRQTFVIWTVVPMAVNGVALGLLFTGLPFSFTALLGLLSLKGMLIKNGIVLIEEIDAQKEEHGKLQSDAIVYASKSRLRPVVLAAGTTILGLLPLVADPFFASMAVAIMAGLGFATILTLIGVPVLYHTYLRKERVHEKRIRKEEKLRLKEEKKAAKGKKGEPKPSNDDESHDLQPVAAE